MSPAHATHDPVLDYTFDWNNAAEVAIETALGEVPVVGSFLSALLQIFWPKSGEDIWSQVEQLINQRFDQDTYEKVQASLSGLNNNMNDYLVALQVGKGDPNYISEVWNTADGDFNHQQPTFQLPGYELLLLPLFAQFANLNLTLLRDGVQNGASWGWTPAIIASNTQKLTSKITAYTQYAQQIYQEGYNNILANTPYDNHNCQPFRAVNNYVRQMTLSVYDFIWLWPYFDVTKYPKPVNIYLGREIYSDPVGTADDSGSINLPSVPTQPISQITVWGWDRIDAAQVSYPAGGGPGGVTTTARMGDQDGGSDAPPHGGVFNVSSNPVTVAAGFSGDILSAITFTFKNGTSTGQIANNYPEGGPFSFSYAGEILSRIHINGISNYYGSADCAVFGFKYERAQIANLDALRRLYIGTALDVTLSDLAARCVTRPIAFNQLSATAAAEGWEAQRQAYWSDLKARR